MLRLRFFGLCSFTKFYSSFHPGIKPLIYRVFSALRIRIHMWCIYDSVNCWSCRWDYLYLNRVARCNRRDALFVVQEVPLFATSFSSAFVRDARRYILHVMYIRVCSCEGGSGEEQERKIMYERNNDTIFKTHMTTSRSQKDPYDPGASMDQECNRKFRDFT